MYKFNYEIDANNYLLAWQEIPFDETKPFIECETYPELIVGVTKVVDNQFVIDEEKRATYIQRVARIQELTDTLRQRLAWFSHYDVQVAEYNREVRLALTPSVDIAALDAQAEIYRTEIVNIRAELESLQ